MKKLSFFFLVIPASLFFFIGFHQPAQSQFSKKEIIFLKYGDKEGEIAANPNGDGCDAPPSFQVDGNKDIFLLNKFHNSVYIFSNNGKLLRIVKNFTSPISGLTVDTDGIVHDLMGNEIIKSKLKVNSLAEKSPPVLSPDEDYKQLSSVLIIDTQKINYHLSKIGRKINQDQIKINTKIKNIKNVSLDVLSVSDNGDVYVLVGDFNGRKEKSFLINEYVNIYTHRGDFSSRINVCLDRCVRDDIVPSFFSIDVFGNLYQICSSKDGVHLYEWLKK